jgi:hypothetical protein
MESVDEPFPLDEEDEPFLVFLFFFFAGLRTKKAEGVNPSVLR